MSKNENFVIVLTDLMRMESNQNSKTFIAVVSRCSWKHEKNVHSRDRNWYWKQTKLLKNKTDGKHERDGVHLF